MTPNLLSQVRIIAATDLRLRLRRPATLWLIVILCGLAYSVIADPATGRALMVVDGARARYTSQVVAIATAGLAAFLLTFAGFYLTSNALRRDLLARTGGIIAATPIGSGPYLIGKFLGGAGYLALVAGAYLINIQVMHLLRGEGPLEPLTFLVTYLLTLGPGILVVAAFALCFECVPLLAGRLGDVAWFFVWTFLTVLGAMSSGEMGEAARAGKYFDVMGLGFILGQVQAATNSTHFAIGMTPFDVTRAAWEVPRIPLTAGVLLPRLTTALFAVPILLVARLFFHRYDPAKVKGGSQGTGGHLIRRLSQLLKPLTRLVSAAGARLVPAAPGALRPILAETVMTLCQSPLVLVGWLAILVASIVASADTVARGLPIALSAFLAIALADLSTRDRAAGVQPMLYSMPRVKPDYARIKFGSALLLALLVSIAPAIRIAVSAPGASLSLLIAAGFMAALATALGLLTRTPKAFMGVFLLFLYLVLNGASISSLDFAGWNGVADASTRVGYLVVTAVLLVVAEGKHRWDLGREG